MLVSAAAWLDQAALACLACLAVDWGVWRGGGGGGGLQEECGSARRGWRPAGRSVPPPHPPVKDIRPDPARETESSARPMKSGPARPGPARPARQRSSLRRIGGRREGRRADHGGGGPQPWAPRTPIESNAGHQILVIFLSSSNTCQVQILVKFTHTRGSCLQILVNTGQRPVNTGQKYRSSGAAAPP